MLSQGLLGKEPEQVRVNPFGVSEVRDDGDHSVGRQICVVTKTFSNWHPFIGKSYEQKTTLWHVLYGLAR